MRRAVPLVTWCARTTATGPRAGRAWAEGGRGKGRGRGREERRKRKRKGGRYSTARPAAALRSRLTMIKAILIFNNHGKPRLSKFYQRYVRAGRGSAGRAGAVRWPGGGVVREGFRDRKSVV